MRADLCRRASESGGSPCADVPKGGRPVLSDQTSDGDEKSKGRICVEHVYDMIIVGGGPAGYTTALYAARAGLDAVLLEKSAPGGQMGLTGEIDNYPGFEEGIDGFTLGLKMQKSAERFGAVTRYAEAISADFSGKIKKIQTAGGIFLGKTVVLAMGASPRNLGLTGEKELTGRGVHYCAHCDGRFYKNKRVLVVGGGNSAAADALYLSRLAAKVTVSHRRNALRAERAYREPLEKLPNVEFLWNSVVTAFLPEGKAVGARVKNLLSGVETDLAADGIFVSIGRKPATEFLRGTPATDKNGYLIADETARTTIDGVFAVGDIRTKAVRQIVTAVSDGATAVHFAEKHLAEKEESEIVE